MYKRMEYLFQPYVFYIHMHISIIGWTDQPVSCKASAVLN